MEELSAYEIMKPECSGREDGIHCDCWYDGKACCGCDDPAEPELEEFPVHP